MAQTGTGQPATGFIDRSVTADGFRIRYCEAGDGPPFVHLHGAGGLRLTPAHDVLARQFRVLAFEMPGFGISAENTGTESLAALADTIVRAADALGLDRFALWGSSFGGKAALELAARHPERVSALVLEAPAAIRPPGTRPAAGSPEARAQRLYGHPERMPPLPEVDPAVDARQQAMVARLIGPARDAELEARMRNLQTPTVVLVGTLDRVIPPEMGRHYPELMPNAHLVLVYDAGHLVAAERPDAFCEVVVDFLARREAFVINRTPSLVHP